MTMRGLFCVDPGGHSGVAWGIVDIASKSVADAMRNRIETGSTTVEGPEAEQIRELYRLWMTFKRKCVVEGRMDPSWIELVFEDFILLPGQHAGGRDGTTPERIAWGFEGYRMGRADQYGPRPKHYSQIRWQIPSSTKKHRSRTKLTEYDAWIVAREHERSAFSHMATRVARLIETYSAQRILARRRSS